MTSRTCQPAATLAGESAGEPKDALPTAVRLDAPASLLTAC